jgi:predicted enzyme related to lactoylglutathione lyase
MKIEGDSMKTHYTLKTGALIRLSLFSLAAGAGILFAAQKTVFWWTATAISVEAPPVAAAEPTTSLQLEKKKMGRPVVHFEIGCRDLAKTNEFYSKLFDWQIQQYGPAGFINTGEGGIPGHTTSLGHEPYNYVTVYVQVDDVKAYLDKAVALGGKMLVPPVEIPTGKFAWMADPEGNMIGLLQPKSAPAK